MINGLLIKLKRLVEIEKLIQESELSKEIMLLAKQEWLF